MSAITTLLSTGWRLYRGETTVGDIAIDAAKSAVDRATNPVSRIPDSIRCEHLLAVGRSGCGKSSFLFDLMAKDIALARKRKRTLIYIDPVNGIDKLVNETGIGSLDNVYLIDPADPDSLPRLNMFETGRDRSSILATTHLINTFRSVCAGIIDQALTPSMTTLLGYCSRVMVLTPDRTLEDMMALLNDPPSYMDGIGMDPDDPVYQFFLENVPAGGKGRGGFTDTAKYVRNRIHAFLNDPIVERLLVNRSPTLRLSDVIDSGSILLVATRKSDIGEDGARLIGKYVKAIMNRVIQERSSLPENSRVPVFYYEDEFHNSLSGGSDACLETMIDENRKFGLSINLATTRLGRLSSSMADAVMNTGIKVCGSMQGQGGAAIARLIGKTVHEVGDLPRHNLFVKIGTDNRPAIVVRTKKNPFRKFRADKLGMTKLRASMSRRFGSAFLENQRGGGNVDGVIVDVDI